MKAFLAEKLVYISSCSISWSNTVYYLSLQALLLLLQTQSHIHVGHLYKELILVSVGVFKGGCGFLEGEPLLVPGSTTHMVHIWHENKFSFLWLAPHLYYM